MMEDGVRNISVNGKYMYSVEDVRKNYPDMKIDTDAIEHHGIPFVPLEGIEPMTEFDKNVLKTLRFKKK